MNSVSKFETFTRLGFAARGLIYIMIGYLSIEAGRATGSTGVLDHFGNSAPARIALVVVAIGLLAYGAWRISEAALDIEGHGDDAKGVAVRIAHGLSGIAHLLLGVLALGLSLNLLAGSSQDGESARSLTTWLLDLPAGEILVRLVGLGFMAAGAAQIVKAVRLGFLKQLEAKAARQEWVKWIGRLGYLARGLLFFLVGVFFWQAGATSDAEEAGGLGDALGSLPGTAQAAVAGGLVLFGIFSLVQAIYRRITNPRLAERMKAQAR